MLEPLRSPLLEQRSTSRRSRRCFYCSLVAGVAAYVVLGALERLVFAQTVLGMPTGVLLMHTLLALMSLSLFVVLQLARSQGAGDGQPVSDVLQRLNVLDVLGMAVLDTLHSLLALEGATAINGVSQALLLQGTVPMVSLLAMLLLPAGTAEGSATPPVRSLRLRMVHAINHLTPGECAARVATSHVTYGTLGAALIFGGVLLAIQTPSAPTLHGGGDGALPTSTGRLVFALSTVVAALATVQKRRCLERQPTDQLVLNTCLAALQLFLGLFLAPPLLLALQAQPIRDTLVQLARGLRCCMSGFNSRICVEASDAYGTPLLLTFFIASTAWSAASFGLLRMGGEAPLAVGSALILPVTLLAFVRPVPLPSSWWWVAAPLRVSSAEVGVTLWLCAALAVFHSAALAGRLRKRGRFGAMFGLESPEVSSSTSSGDDSQKPSGVSPTELLGPSLHL